MNESKCHWICKKCGYLTHRSDCEHEFIKITPNAEIIYHKEIDLVEVYEVGATFFDNQISSHATVTNDFTETAKSDLIN